MRKREKWERKNPDGEIVDFMMVINLIRGKQFNRNRLQGKYILMQFYLAWKPYIKEQKQSIKNTSSGLLESFRGLTLTEEGVSYKSNNFT